jgi:hypothetical protein
MLLVTCQTEFSQSECTSSVLVLAPEIKRKEYALNKMEYSMKENGIPKKILGVKVKEKHPKGRTNSR